MYLQLRNQQVQTNGKDLIIKNSFLDVCKIPRINNSIFGEDGMEFILNDEDEKFYKKEIALGYKDFAFNEFVSKNVALGIYNVFNHHSLNLTR